MRVKMDRTQRAKQFAPFEALTGLRNALRIKEFQHESVVKGELSEDSAAEISAVMMELNKGEKVTAEIYDNGHVYSVTGSATILPEKCEMKIDDKSYSFDKIRGLKKLD